VNAVEYKGSTTTEKLAPPQVNPTTLSQGYAYKGPGEANTTAPQQWEVESYAFAPGFVTVQQGDAVAVRAFVVNGDKHDVSVLAPDGQVVVPTATWTRGGEYQISFKAEKVGTYKLSCAIHAPSMTANIFVLPR
jgi:plastocyanin